MGRKLAYHWSERAKWNSVTKPIPEPGDYLASDGVDTWVIRCLDAGPIGDETIREKCKGTKVLFPGCRVLYWRAVK